MACKRNLTIKQIEAIPKAKCQVRFSVLETNCECKFICPVMLTYELFKYNKKFYNFVLQVSYEYANRTDNASTESQTMWFTKQRDPHFNDSFVTDKFTCSANRTIISRYV